jgi:hypothetical protein
MTTKPEGNQVTKEAGQRFAETVRFGSDRRRQRGVIRGYRRERWRWSPPRGRRAPPFSIAGRYINPAPMRALWQ